MKNMIELGADIQAARKKQLEVDKRKEKREKKEAKKHKAVK